jgi:putative lipoprotein (rSAM/lipoprotein system)
MKKVEIRFLKSFNSIIALILAFLGFSSSCKGPQVEYGVPSAKYIIKGKIELSVDSSELSDIQVIVQNDTTTSDVNGNYIITKTRLNAGNQTFPIQFRDVDGVLHGEIAPLDTTVEFKNPVFKNGDGNWYEGETEKEFDVKLKPR